MATAPILEDRAEFGMVLMLAAWLMFALVDTGAKWVAVAGLSAAQIAFFRYAGHFAVNLVQFARRPDRDIFQSPYLGLILIRGALLVAATFSNFYVLRFLPLTTVSAIMFTSPVIVCFLSVIFLKERVGLWRWSAILLGFIGVLVVIRPIGAAFHPAMLLVVMNATFLAIYSLLTRRLADKVSADTMQFHMGLLGTVVLLPPAILSWQSTDTIGWLALIAIGPIAWFGHQMLTTAHRFATANTLMPFTYSFLLYLTVLSYLVFGDLPDLFTLLGAAIIMASGLIIWRRERLRTRIRVQT
ncbi:DMT family transporter [Primorskyibacter sp. S187A]|uniref:DMT family transporter n=1 Tax=Primorskyibacter sp. S187A TaxID=3415130 RepID=UPI003C7BE36C